MICHVCKQQAVGQCKSCGKFYCRQHGDVYCTPCSTNIKPEEQAIKREVEFGASGEPKLATSQQIAGPRCYACQCSANRACSKCGVFFCPQHGGLYATLTALEELHLYRTKVTDAGLKELHLQETKVTDAG